MARYGLRSFNRHKNSVPAFCFGLLFGVALSLSLFVAFLSPVIMLRYGSSGQPANIFHYVKGVVRANSGKSAERLAKDRGNATIKVHIPPNEIVNQPLSVAYWDTLTDARRLQRIPGTIAKEMNLKEKVSISILDPSMKTSSVANLISTTWGQALISENKEAIILFTNNPDEYQTNEINVKQLTELPYDDFTPSATMVYQVLKHLCTAFIDQFHFFYIVSSNTYVNVGHLEDLLLQINESNVLLLGNGVPTLPDDIFFSNDPEVYCKLEPGFVLSRKSMKHICPHIDVCEKEFSNITSPPGLEIARCFYKYLNTTCTSSKQVTKMFYSSSHLQRYPPINELKEAVALHPIFLQSNMHSIHRFFLQKQMNDTKSKNDRYYKIVQDMDRVLVKEGSMPDDRLILGRNWDKNKFYHEDIVPWDAMEAISEADSDDIFLRYSVESDDIATEISYQESIDFNHMRDVALNMAKSNTTSSYEIIKQCRRLLPAHGYQYMFDIKTENELNTIQIDKPYGRTVVHGSYYAESSKIVFVLPVMHGEHDISKYMQHFEQAGISADSPENIALLLVIFTIGDTKITDTTSKVLQLLTLYKQKYPKLSLSWIDAGNVPYAFMKGIDLAVLGLPFDALICSTDVRIRMYPEFLHNIRLNVIFGKRLFFPVPFQSFNEDGNSKLEISTSAGFWRNFDYNIFCGYKQDIVQAYGGDNIESGKDLFQNSVTAGFEVLRAPESNIIMSRIMSDCSSLNYDEKQKLLCENEQNMYNIAYTAHEQT